MTVFEKAIVFLSDFPENSDFFLQISANFLKKRNQNLLENNFKKVYVFQTLRSEIEKENEETNFIPVDMLAQAWKLHD